MMIDSMPFKMSWEKTSARKSLPEGLVARMVHHAYPEKKLVNYALLAGGCANLNIKIQLADDELPLILRVYLRDRDACSVEQKLGDLLSRDVPVPLTLYSGEVDGYRFAFTQFMTGIPLRDLLLGDQPYDLHSIMSDVGKVLSSIAGHTFPHAGGFDKDLNVTMSFQDLYGFAEQCLSDQAVIAALSPSMILSMRHFLKEYQHLLPDTYENRLVHGDFDPANILVSCREGTWKVSAVLDWEFTFVGASLWDVANMFRYAHQMPSVFTSAFLEGFVSTGMLLPKDWFITTRLLNLCSLLDCLKRADPVQQANQCADIYSLIERMLHELETTSRTSYLF